MASTVTVNLKRDWFGQDGSLYKVRDNPHVFPASFAAAPKKREEESDEDFERRKKASKYEVLPSTAEVVEDAATVAAIQKTGGGEEVVEPQTVEGDVDSVGGKPRPAGTKK